MKRLFFCITAICFFCLFSAVNASADLFTFQLSANQSALDSEFDAVIDNVDNNIIAGINGLYKSDDYKFLFVKTLISDDIFIDGLTGGLGFKGTWGEAEKRYIDGDILNAGFAGTVSYDLSKSNLNNFPVTLSSSLFFSPEPLCFEDAKSMFEFTAEGSWKVLDQAAIIVSFRYLDLDFKNHVDWEKSDTAGYLGLKFFF